MNTDLKITVITPTFNRAHTLERAFESLKNQTFKNFKWIVMDDGSTDDTKKLIERLKSETSFEIEYFYHSNRHKFHTVFDGIRKVKSQYFTILDSDDSYPANALQTLFDEAEKIDNQDEYIAATGLSGDENNQVVGDHYPGNGFDGSILEMRYKYRIKGDKNGIFITKTYLKELSNFDESKIPEGIYIPQSVFFNSYDSKGLKSRFINKIIRIYHKDENDAQSVSNTRWSGKNRYGLMLGYLSFLNSYGKQLNSYPKTLIRNIVGYQIYALATGKAYGKINSELKHFKVLAALSLPFSYVFSKIKPDKIKLIYHS